MKNIFSILLLLSAIFYSCSDNEPNNYYTIATDKEVIEFDNPDRQQHVRLYVESDGDWVVDYPSDSWFYILEDHPKTGNDYVSIYTKEKNDYGDEDATLKVRSLNGRANEVSVKLQKAEKQGVNILDSIPDEKFREFLINQLKTEYITKGDMLSIIILNCKQEAIRELDGIGYCKDLESLNCSNNSLSEFDVRKNTKLKWLDCSYNLSLGDMDLSENIRLEELNCARTREFDILDLSKNTKLRKLDVSYKLMSKLDLTNNTELVRLAYRLNKLTKLDLSKNTKLIELNCSLNNLETIDVSNNKDLLRLDCSDNLLTSLDLTENINLGSLYCVLNELSELDVRNNLWLYRLSAESNKISKGKLHITENIYNTASLSPAKGDEIYNVSK